MWNDFKKTQNVISSAIFLSITYLTWIMILNCLYFIGKLKWLIWLATIEKWTKIWIDRLSNVIKWTKARIIIICIPYITCIIIYIYPPILFKPGAMPHQGSISKVSVYKMKVWVRQKFGFIRFGKFILISVQIAP